MGPVSQALELLGTLPAGLLVALLSAGAFLENVVPPIPADTFVVVGGLLAAQDQVPATATILGIWVANVAGALGIYHVGHRHGRGFFQEGLGRRLLRPRQVERISRFYERWGIWAIFLARFLPGLRAVVPGFAGVSHLGFWRVAPPVAVASAIWYGLLLWLGVQAGRNLAAAEVWFLGLNRTLLVVALGVVGLVLAWWLATRWVSDDDER